MSLFFSEIAETEQNRLKQQISGWKNMQCLYMYIILFGYLPDALRTI